MLEQSIADVLTLRAVGGEALTNRMKQAQAVSAPERCRREQGLWPPPQQGDWPQAGAGRVSVWACGRVTAGPWLLPCARSTGGGGMGMP